MAYHGFVEQDGKYAILMDREDVEALLHILGAHSGGYSRAANHGEFAVLAGMFDAAEKLGFASPRSSKMYNRDGGDKISNWYYKEK